MSESKHTPGPWKWSTQYPGSDGRETYSLIGGGGYGILSCDGLGNSPQTCNKANAPLIEAAPDLLEALKNLYAMVEGESPSLLEDDVNAINALRAIAKAEGRP